MMRDGYNIFGKRIPCRNAYCANNPSSRSHMGDSISPKVFFG